MVSTLTGLETRQAEHDPSQDESTAVQDTKRQAEAARERYGSLLAGRKRIIRARHKRKPEAIVPDYEGLTGAWANHYNVARRYEGKIPAQDRDDWRHDAMLELERAENRDGKPLPPLRAYRIASLMVALYYRQLNRWQSKVCIVNGYPTEPHCKGCQNRTDNKRCAWLAVRPLERLDGEVLDADGYKVKLIDTVASNRVEDMPDRWFDLKQLTEALPPRLAEIAYKKLEGKPLSETDRKYLYRYRKMEQKTLF